MSRKRHNPERRVFRGRSYKKHGEHLSVLREKEPHLEDEPRCTRCEQAPAEAEHTCPYNQELGDGTKLCTCCYDCEHECAMDI